MTKKILFLVIFSLTFLPLISTKAEGDFVVKEPKNKAEITAKKLDPEAEILAAYLAKYHSPLQYHAQDFIDAARVYSLDWKLVASIAGVESTFGKFIPGGYNGWGWGVYGTQAIYFNSWREGIFTVSKGLRENYVNKGLTEPYAMNRVYATSFHWGGNVTYFMNDLEKFAANYQFPESLVKTLAQPQIAAISGKLVY